MTKVLLADDHALVRDGLRHILRSASGFEVVGEACDGPTTIASFVPATRRAMPRMVSLSNPVMRKAKRRRHYKGPSPS